jgi:hypothetical protein
VLFAPRQTHASLYRFPQRAAQHTKRAIIYNLLALIASDYARGRHKDRDRDRDWNSLGYAVDIRGATRRDR